MNELDTLTVVLGGPHFAGTSESYVKPRRIVVRGEGEYPLLLLSRMILFGEGELDGIPSISYSTNGYIKSNPIDYGPYRDVDLLPLPDYSLLYEYKHYFPCIVTSRGCVYNCHFCSEGRTNHPYRPRSICSIKKEMIMIKELYGEDLRYFSFNDDTFTTSRERVHAICDVIDEVFPRKNDFGFYCEGRVNVLARHPELIRRLKVAGLMRLQIGIESGDQDTLNRINKNIRIREIEQVVKTAYEAGVFTIFGAFICGLPGQSEEEVKSDIDFAKRLIDSAPGAMEVAMGMFTPMPGTEFRENAQRWGVKLFDPEFVTGIVIENCLSETDLLKRDTIEELSKLFESEIDRYINSKIYTIHPERLKQAFALAADMNLIPLVVRKLRKYKHCSKLLVLRARQDHRFLHEIPPQEQVLSAPYNVDSTTTSCDEDCIINEGSLMSFVLDKEAMRYYQYFCGKLSFRGIAVRVSRESAESPERCLQACLAVYQKCEDKMSAICMV